MSLGLQYAVIALAVLFSAGYVVHTRLPKQSRALRVALAVPLVREGRPLWMRRVGRWLAPPRNTVMTCRGCDGCSTD